MTTRDILTDIKSSHSCVEFMQSAGFRVRHNGDCITAPHQIRPDDRNPSFAVWHNGAKDFATGKFYDLFDLVMAIENCSFVQAVQKFDPSLFTPQHPHLPPEAARKISDNRAALKDNVAKWHEALLRNPVCVDPFTQEHIRALDYLHSRGLTDETIEELKLGYNAEDGYDADHRRIIIPFFRGGQPVYYAGRDLTSRYKQLDPEGKKFGQKYKYCANDDGIEKIIWGLDTIRKPITEHSRKALIADLEGSVAEEYLRDDTLFICEGLLDAAILIQDGWQVLCSGGGAFGRYNMPLVIDIMRMFPQVVLAFDNDEAGKNFARRYGELCIDEHIKFTVAEIPSFYDGHTQIKDINDYYLAGGSLSDIAKNAKPGLIFMAEALTTLNDVHDFVNKCAPFASEYDLQMVKEMLAAKRLDPPADENGEHIPGMPAVEPMFKSKQLNYAFDEALKKTPDKVIISRVMRNHDVLYAPDGKFYEFTGKAWEQITQQTVTRYVADAIGPSARSGRCQAVMNFMKAIEESTIPFNTQNIFAFKNGVLLLDEAAKYQNDPSVCFVPHSPDFMNTAYVDYEINPYHRWGLRFADNSPDQFLPMKSSADDGQYHAPLEKDSPNQLTIDADLAAAGSTPNAATQERAPLWRECCRKWFVDEHGNYDWQLERQAQLMAGYVFFPDNRFQKGFILVGKGSNGKSTFLEVLRELFGAHNCASLSPDRLTNPFDVMQIRTAMLNICHESARSLRGAEEILKAVISGDPVTGSYKCQDAVSFKPRAKWIIAANSIMDIKDVSYGFLRRMVVIPFNAKFKDNAGTQGRGRPAAEKVDYDLLDKLKEELPEILWWAFEGYKMLKNGARFEKTADQLRWDEKLRETIDPAYLFTTECLEGYLRHEAERGVLTDEREVFKWYMDWCKDTCNEVSSRYQSIGRIIDAMDDVIPDARVSKLCVRGEYSARRYFIFPDIEILDWEKFDEPSQEKLRKMGCTLHVDIEEEEEEKTPETAPEAPAEAAPEEAPVIPEAPAKCTDEAADGDSHTDIPPFSEDVVVNGTATPAEVPEPEDKAPAGEGETPAVPAKTSAQMYPHCGYKPSVWDLLTFINQTHYEDWYMHLTPEEWCLIVEYAKAKLATSTEEDKWIHELLLARLRKGWVLKQQGRVIRVEEFHRLTLEQITSGNQEEGGRGGLASPDTPPEPEE